MPSFERREQPGHRHRPRPSPRLRRPRLRGPAVHPADDDAAPPGVLEGLRRVEVEAVVGHVTRLDREPARAVVEPAHEDDGLRPVEAHRGDDEHVVIAEREEVRALPHRPERAVALGGHRLEGPPAEVPGLEEQRGPPAVALRSGDHPPPPSRAPDLRVAEVGGRETLGRGGEDGVRRVLREDASVRARREALDLPRPVARVDEAQHAPVVHRAAREAASRVGAARGRREGDRQVPPAHEVGAHRVSPVHRAPVRAEGVVLVEEVVLAPEVREAVRVVHPPRGRREVPEWPPGVDVRRAPRRDETRRRHTTTANATTNVASPLLVPMTRNILCGRLTLLQERGYGSSFWAFSMSWTQNWMPLT